MARRSRGRNLSGILLLDKDAGCTSNQALQQLKRLYAARKAGHTGSLDPLATGMLPVCFGAATRLSGFLLAADKAYETCLRLGRSTDSGDADGQVVGEAAVPPGLERRQLEALLARFQGEQQQVPPMVSALKLNGQRLHALARQGQVVARTARRITIRRLELLAFEQDRLRLRVLCSKGTYIRSLAMDIGVALGCGAHVETLRRLYVAPFGTAGMHTLAALTATAPCVRDTLLLPADAAVRHLPAATVASAGAFCHGQTTPAAAGCPDDRPGPTPPAVQSTEPGSLWRIYDADGRFLGLGTLGACTDRPTDVSGASLMIAPRRVLQGVADANLVQ